MSIAMPRRRAAAVALAFAAATIVGSPVRAVEPVTSTAIPQPGPIDESGDIQGAPYRIRVPAVWNGTLLVFAHGYRDKADHPGEVDNRNADVAPSAALEAPLLAQGYALAGSAFRDNGWAIKEGSKDLSRLVKYFKKTIADPPRTILWAASTGSIIALRAMEKQVPGLYDGGLALCGMGAGATRTWDQMGDLTLAYDTVFGFPPSWGSYANVRDDIDFDTEVLAKLAPELSNIANFPKFEFLRLVTGIPGRGITPPPPPSFFPVWALTDMFFATEARSELERRAGGAIYANSGRTYAITPAERAYLAGIGLPSPVVDGWLAQMNGQANVTASKNARKYLAENSDFKGGIKAPVLTLHTVVDPLATVAHEAEYAATVNAAGRSSLLYQAYTSGVGHCSFTGPQLLSAVAAIDSWVQSGVPPTAASFPAALGYVPGFVPPHMN